MSHLYLDRRTDELRRVQCLSFSWLGCCLLAGTLACGQSDQKASDSGTARPGGEESQVVKQPKEAGQQGRPRPESLEPRELLRTALAAYRSAPAYRDRGRLFFEYEQGGNPGSDAVDFAVAFERPGRLRLDVYQATVAVDSGALRAHITDLPDQLLVREISSQVGLADIYADEILNSVLSDGIAGRSPQLEMLLGEDPLGEILLEAEDLSVLAPQSIHGKTCHGVQIRLPGGDLVFWVDAESSVIRRLEYPVESIPGGRKLVADFFEAEFQPSQDSGLFTLAASDGLSEVRSFVPPALPVPPLLGKRVDGYGFQGLDGSTISSVSLAGKVAVLDFWFVACPPCVERLPRLQAIYEKYKDNPQVEFWAVNVDDPNLPDERLQETFQEWGVNIPIARDLKQHAASAFQCQAYPVLFLLGPDGTVHDVETPLIREVIESLPTKIDQLLEGESVTAAVREEFETQEAAYQQAVAAAAPGAADEEETGVKIAPPSDPTHFVRESLWTVDTLAAPGNVAAVVGSAGNPMFHVLDGANRVVEIDHAGTIQGEHDLGLAEGEVIAYLRSSPTGQQFVASASSQPQCHLFSENWSPRLKLPEAPTSQSALADVQWCDLDLDGQHELMLAFWGDSGVQHLSLDGELFWRNATLENVARVAVIPPEISGRNGPEIWCAHDRGTIIVLDASGEEKFEFPFENRFLFSVVAAKGKGEVALCGLALDPRGRVLVVGLDPRGRERWSYALPGGTHGTPVEILQPCDVPSLQPAEWVAVGADGSVHFLSPQGALVDKFNTGHQPRGVAVADQAGNAVLVLTSPEAVSAMRLGSG